jgi:hypothetical protein
LRLQFKPPLAVGGGERITKPLFALRRIGEVPHLDDRLGTHGERGAA